MVTVIIKKWFSNIAPQKSLTADDSKKYYRPPVIKISAFIYTQYVTYRCCFTDYRFVSIVIHSVFVNINRWNEVAKMILKINISNNCQCLLFSWNQWNHLYPLDIKFCYLKSVILRSKQNSRFTYIIKEIGTLLYNFQCWLNIL